MTESKSEKIKDDQAPSTGGETNSGDAAGGGNGGRRRRGKGAGKAPGIPSKAAPKPVVPKFEGMDKKELEGKVIVFSENRRTMAANWIRFEAGVFKAAGKSDPMLAGALRARKRLTLGEFMTPAQDASEYTIGKDKDGQPLYDEKMKALYLKADDLLVAKAVDAYTLYNKNWKIFFFRIMGQIDSDTTARMEMSKDWAGIEQKCDSVALMQLLQKICVHGTDRDYLPERIINCLAALINTSQGKSNPTEFSESMMSNNQVLIDVVGHSIFGQMPTLQKFVIDNNDEFNFTFDKLNSQADSVKARLSTRCDECIMGCNMTLRSNKEKSDMNIEVHKSLLSKQGNAFAINTTEAVDQMVGFESMKKKSSNRRTGNNDTSSALVLVGISNVATDDAPKTSNDGGDTFRCYHCGEAGHSQYKCPLLTKDERQALYVKDRTKDNNIDKAVMFHLGGALCDDDDSNNQEPGDEHGYQDQDQDQADLFDPNSGSDEGANDRFVFCQITEDSLHTDSESADDDESNRIELIRVLTNVANAQRKNNPDAWANAVVFKLSTIGVTTSASLSQHLPIINSLLRKAGQTAFHNTTLGGIAMETSGPTRDFRKGHA